MNKCMTPLWQHDCDKCKFLGVFESHDLYFCEQGGTFPTVIARYGSDGWQYISGLCFRFENRAIREAWRRAVASGLLAEQESYPMDTADAAKMHRIFVDAERAKENASG